MKQQLTDIVIQLTQLLNSVSIDTRIDASSIAVTLSDGNVKLVTNCVIKVKDNKHHLNCIYFTEACDRHYEITVGILNLIQLVEYDINDNDEWNNKYTTLYLEGEWLIN